MAEAFSYEKAMKDHGITQKNVDNFREALKSSEYVPKATMDKVLLMTLISYDNNLVKSLQIFNNFCKFVTDTPEWFTNRDIDSVEIQQAFDNQIYVSLPPTPENFNLILHKASNYEPKNYIFDNAEKAFLITIGELRKIVLKPF